MTREQPSSRRGEPAKWVISAWTTGGNVPDSTVRLTATPAREAPVFSFGCGSNDGSASCDLGAIDARSARRQLQAQLTVPAGASTVHSVVLTATGSAAHLPRDPMAAATVTITAVTRPITPAPISTPLAVSSLPDIPTPSPTLSPGGNAANLFPTLAPSPDPSPSRSASAARKASTRPVADTTALPEGASAVGAQLAGLAALAVAFILAVTRISIRRRPVPVPPVAPVLTAGPAPAPAADQEPAAAEPVAESAAEPDAAPESGQEPVQDPDGN